VVPVIPRTRPRNTARLVNLLEPLTKYGFPLDQVLVEGMGRFPVAGVAYYRDDWLNPRYNPVPHLHHGLDIFADFGTPIRSPDRGYVSRFSNNPDSGGIGVWTRGSDGMAYYFAHLLERAPGLRIGQRVDVGTVIGYVGDTGNALGGAPHLHFEIHPYGGAAVPPKPSVDKWLDEAEKLAPRWVGARRQEIDSKRNVLGGEPGRVNQPNKAELEASMLLTLLDPVGGSVGLLPRLQLAPEQRHRISSGVLLEVIRLRLDGYLFAPSSQGQHLRD
jgi:murein DD-endopeptidase MepM/ murein hydrolase activator NlpD